MRREARRGKNRSAFNEACQPKPPSCTEPSHSTPSSSIPLSFRPSSSSFSFSLSSSSSCALPCHLSLPFSLHSVGFICCSCTVSFSPFNLPCLQSLPPPKFFSIPPLNFFFAHSRFLLSDFYLRFFCNI